MDSAQNCQFGNLGRNALRDPDFVWSDFYLTKWFNRSERVKLRIDGQFFNVFNHPNFALPSTVIAGIPGIRPPGLASALTPLSPHYPPDFLGVGPGRRQFPSHDRLPGEVGVLDTKGQDKFSQRVTDNVDGPDNHGNSRERHG